MGGIKNKLNKLSNKAKTLFSNLTSPIRLGSSASGTASRKTPASRAFDDIGLRSKTVGLLSITKYVGITCLSLAILSTLILNIISSYSSSKIESNAIDSNSEPSTLANDSSSISLSFSNATGSCSDTSNPANVCMSIPDDGGIATGGHTVTVNAPSDSDYRLTLSSANNETDLANGSNRIASTPNPASIGTLNDLTDKTWGMSITTSGSVAADPIYGLQPVDNPLILIDTQSGNGVVGVGPAIDVQYGAKVMDPSLMPAGSYSADLVYTATAIVPPATLTNLVLNDTLLTGQQKEFAVQGTNLATANRVTLCNADDPYLCYVTDDVRTYANTAEAGTIISFVSPEVDVAGVYDVIVRTVGGEARLDDSFRVVEQSICMNGVNANSDCQVDIDANMIPIRYVGNNSDGSAIWVTVSQNEIDHTPGLWYDYGKKQWANAVTVTSSSLSKYKNKSQVVVDNNDVMGYWVYIPRYAYEVQRRDATDHFVVDEYPLPDNVYDSAKNASARNSHVIKNEFIIQFETSDIAKKSPATSCNANINTAGQMWYGGTSPDSNEGQGNLVLARDYRTDCGLNRNYGQNSTWATHPAFSWNGNLNNEELNGIWFGKFETTGTSNAPKIKPNERPFSSRNVDDWYLGTLFDVNKSIGIRDSNNTGGNNVAPLSRNSHNLAKSSSHMTKNSEWGAITYLSSSYYGSGVNAVQPNNLEHGSCAGNGITCTVTGCGPYDDGSNTSYADPGEMDTPLACSASNAQRSYNGNIGVKSSTTGNVYGIYDMAGGADEYIMGNITSSSLTTPGRKDAYFRNPSSEPYVDLIKTQDGFNSQPKAWSANSPYGENSLSYNFDYCTYEICGGQATYEVMGVQSQSFDGSALSYHNAWGNSRSTFVDSYNVWFNRGGVADSGGTFSVSIYDIGYRYGDIYYDNGSRASLIAE